MEDVQSNLVLHLLDNNGSLPVVSDVEYHFLPGDYYTPTYLTLNYLCNFSIVGSKTLSTVFIGSVPSYVEILDSVNVTITNIVFKRQDIHFATNEHVSKSHFTYNLAFTNCFSCKVMNVNFLEYGFYGTDLLGKSYLSNITLDVTDSLLCCSIGIFLLFTSELEADYPQEYFVVLNRISMNGIDIFPSKATSSISAGIHVHLPGAVNNITIIISNSYFYNMPQAKTLYIYSDTTDAYAPNTMIEIENCTFNECLNSQSTLPLITVEVACFNVTLTFLRCNFYNIHQSLVLSIIIYECEIPITPCCISSSNITITDCLFIDIKYSALKLYSHDPLTCVNVYIIGPFIIANSGIGENFGSDEQTELVYIENSILYITGPVNLSGNNVNSIISVHSSYILLNGPIIVSNNTLDVQMLFHSSDVLFNGPITISENSGSIIQTNSCNVTFNGPVTISMSRECDYIMLLQYSDVLFSERILFQSNLCHNIIVIKSQDSAYIKVSEYSNITFAQNKNCNYPIVIKTENIYYNFYPFCIFQYVILENISAISPSHYTIIISDSSQYCKAMFYHFTSHCKWISAAAFNDQNPGIINQQIIKLDYKLQHMASILLCSNISIDMLGAVYPGQMLQVELCILCSDTTAVLYVETHNTLLPKSACKIAHQTELVNIITNNSKTVSYTIISEANDSCELFLTVSPFLYKIYEVFDVQLLPCPVGFTLQNGVCDCDPLLPTDIDTCFIDHSAIRRPANTWISYTQSSTSKYLISDCPMDYCLPFSSNIDLLYPDTQCQFNRTGILCSQCQYPLSMVFGSSRCMKCTNVHVLITIIVIVAGIALVVLLYLLNLTVTKGSINGIILYANIISINGSIFLVNNNVGRPLYLFISFANLDLGIETCFYDGMDSYIKMWLQLFFPVYLMIIAFSIIIASRYSSRILRLTYKRSLPVLATLFLLSYTSVLRTVLTVLFSYSTITHVPSGHQELVWSVDASISLFGLKFTILFITCLVLFLILLFFNIILLFTRCLSQFKLINHFKPILDAFQGSYKDRYYYWVAVHIILRSIFFVLYAFQMKIRLLLATVFLVLLISSFGVIYPNKIKFINLQELLLLINLCIIHVVSLQNTSSTIVTNIMISLAFIQFCLIAIYHFLTYTCHFNVLNILCVIKKKLVRSTERGHQINNINVALLDIPITVNIKMDLLVMILLLINTHVVYSCMH